MHIVLVYISKKNF